MQLMLDTYEYKSKPNDIGAITYRIVKNPVDIDIEELAHELTKGKTIVPGLLKEKNGLIKCKKEYWSQQQVIMLDFDNEDGQKNKCITMTLQQAIDEFKSKACFIYETFSSTPEHPKFRVVFALVEPVQDYLLYEAIITRLLQEYPSADPHCRNGNRLFFGGMNLIELNYENRLKVEEVFGTPLGDIKNYLKDMSSTPLRASPSTQSSQAAKSSSQRTAKDSSNKKNNLEGNNLSLIKEKNIEKLQHFIQPKPISLKNEDLFDYLKQQDLRLFLGIKTKGNFIDIFHDEVNPSASIYLSEKGNGHQLYKCFSTSNPFSGSIIEIVGKLVGCSDIEVKRFLTSI